jgi:hypothetical protein
MKKNRKFMIAGILALVAAVVIGTSIPSFADSRDTGSASTTEAVETATQKKVTTNLITASEAKKKAVNHAVRKYGISRSSVYDCETDRDHENGREVWEVSFNAKNSSGRVCEFDYDISCSDGSIERHHTEYDDDDRYEIDDHDHDDDYSDDHDCSCGNCD